MNHDVFISYSSKNPTAAQAICHELEDNGIKCWMAPRDITPGKKYGDLIDDAILTCRVFLLVYSADSLSSQWCNGELNVAFTEGKTIIPYRIDATPLKGAMRVILNQTHWIDAYPNYKTRFKDLVAVVWQSLGKNIPSTFDDVHPPVPIPQPTLNRFKKYWWVALCALILGVAVWCILPEKSEVSTNISAEAEIISEQATPDLIAQESTDSKPKTNAELEELRAEKALIEKENETKTAKSSTTIQTELKSSTFTQKTTTTSTSKVEHKSVQTATAQKTEAKETKNDNSYLLNLPDNEFDSFVENGKSGFRLKSTGEIVVPAKYDFGLYFFQEGLAPVELNGKWGCIDKTGKEVIPLKYYHVSWFEGGLASVQFKLNGNFAFINNKGEVVVTLKYNNVFGFAEGLAPVELNGKWGYVDKIGKEIIPLKYDAVKHFSEGLALVKLEGKWGVVDKLGKSVISHKYDYIDSFDEGLAIVELNNKYGVVNRMGREIIPLRYNVISPFSEGLAAVKLGGKWGFMDRAGKDVIPFKYQDAKSFEEGLAAVKLGSKWGFIDKNGDIVIQIQYDEIYIGFHGGVSAVKLDGKWGLINKFDKKITKFIYDDVTSIINDGRGITGVKLNGEKFYIDKNGNRIE